MICPNCGASASDEMNFCEECGMSLKAVRQQPVQQEITASDEKNGLTGETKASPKNLKGKVRLIMTITISVLVAIAMISVIIFSVANHIYYSYPEGMLEAGSRYLAELKYEEAIIEFDKIIAIEPKNVKAYLLKAEALLALDEKKEALETLYEGYAITENKRILDMIKDIEEEEREEAEEEPDGVISGYVTDTEGNPVRQVRVIAKLISEGASVSYALNENNGTDSSSKVYNSETNGEGYWTLEIKRGLYLIQFEKNGYIYYSTYYESFPEKTEVFDTIVLHINDNSEQTATATLKITNGLNYTNVNDAKIVLREDWDNFDGELVTGEFNDPVTIYSDSDGKAYINIKKGMYTAEISKNGFGTIFANISVADNYYTEIYLAPKLNETDYRIVLTWGETPSDLDSHLVGAYGNRNFEVYYSSKEFGDAINLDIDDTSSFGPETITVYYDSEFGRCEYYVHDFSNSSYSASTALSYSNAKVMVYKGQYLIGEYNVPVGYSGNCWHVFEIVDGEIIPINVIDSNRSSYYDSTSDYSYPSTTAVATTTADYYNYYY